MLRQTIQAGHVAPERPLLLPPPDRLAMPSIEDLISRSAYDLIFFQGSLRPVEEVMMACCQALGGYARHTMLPAPMQPSSIAQLDGKQFRFFIL